MTPGEYCKNEVHWIENGDDCWKCRESERQNIINSLFYAAIDGKRLRASVDFQIKDNNK